MLNTRGKDRWWKRIRSAQVTIRGIWDLDRPMTQINKKVNVLDIQRKKKIKQPISMITAYDYTSALLVDRSPIDIILVGDSLGMVMLGYSETVGVTMDEMLHHCRAVAQGSKRAFLVGDLPFLSYQTGLPDAVLNAGRLLKEGGMHAVKLEGGAHFAPTITALVQAGIPVMGHIGLTPQRTSQLGGYRVQGRTAVSAFELLEDALALEAAGCFAIVLEAVPREVGALVTSKLSIPIIGIGAGPDCDGQVLVFHDLLGLYDDLKPRFVKEYAQIGQTIDNALEAYHNDIINRHFPTTAHSYHMKKDEQDKLSALLKEK